MPSAPAFVRATSPHHRKLGAGYDEVGAELALASIVTHLSALTPYGSKLHDVFTISAACTSVNSAKNIVATMIIFCFGTASIVWQYAGRAC